MEWETLKAQCLACRSCGLCETRTNVVFGQGAEDAEVLFVGEGPGQSEDEQGLPFVGRSGQLLDKYLFAIDLDRKKNCYIANIVKCRPPKNRDPQAEEQDACIPYLNDQIQLVQPKIIVCLGRIAAARLIHDGYRITREHGTWSQQQGIWMTAFYHPSALLRDESKRPETFDDLRSLRAKILEVCPEVYNQ